jgi:hypothetical protein
MRSAIQCLALTLVAMIAAGCGETSSETGEPAAQGNGLLDAAMKVQRPGDAGSPQNAAGAPAAAGSPSNPAQAPRTRPTAKNIGGIADPSSVLSGSEQGSLSPAQQSGSIIHQTTREVADAQSLRQSGAVAASSKVEMGDPITISMSVYKSVRGKIPTLQIKHAVDLFNAEHGRYPRDFAEFKKEILDPFPDLNLPALPDYQRYGYDPQKHELVILEYPNLKRAAGR